MYLDASGVNAVQVSREEEECGLYIHCGTVCITCLSLMNDLVVIFEFKVNKEDASESLVPLALAKFFETGEGSSDDAFLLVLRFFLSLRPHPLF